MTLIKIVQDVPDTIVGQKRFQATRILGTQEKLALTTTLSPGADGKQNVIFADKKYQIYDVTCVTRNSDTTATTTTTGGCNNIATTVIQGTCTPGAGEDNVTVSGQGFACTAPIGNADINLTADVTEDKETAPGSFLCVSETKPVILTVSSPSTYSYKVTLSVKTATGTAPVIQILDNEGAPILAGDGTTTLFSGKGTTDIKKNLLVKGLSPGTACLTATYYDSTGCKSDAIKFTVMNLLTLKATDKANDKNVVEDKTAGTDITPVLIVWEGIDGKAKVILNAVTDPATEDVLRKVLYRVDGKTADHPSGAFDPAMPTEITLTPTDGNRKYTISAGLDCNNDKALDVGEITRVVEVVVAKLDKLRVADGANQGYYVEDIDAVSPVPALRFCNLNSVKVKLSAELLPTDIDRAKVLWAVEGNAAVPANGNFSSDPEVTLTSADDASREFTINSGGDRNSNGSLDPDEITRAVKVVLGKVELVIPTYIGVGQTVDGWLNLAGGTTTGKWLISYDETLLKITDNQGAVIRSDQLSADVTLPQTIAMRIEALKAGSATVWATFIPEGEEAGCLDAEITRIAKIDLDVDSDNNNYTGPLYQSPPGRTDDEDKIEDGENQLGKVMGMNDNDDDRDGIRDNIDLNNLLERDFIPVILEIPEPVDIAKAKINITIPRSIRLWRKAGNEPRKDGSVKTGGDIVETGEYEGADLARLGFTNGNRTVTLCVEGLAPSAGRGTERILVELDPDGSAGVADYVVNDAVKLTVIRPDADVDTDRDGSITDADDPEEYTKGYTTWRGDGGGTPRPWGMTVAPSPAAMNLTQEDWVYADLIMTASPSGGEITIMWEDPPNSGTYGKRIFNDANRKWEKIDQNLWSGRKWTFWAGDFAVARYTVPGVYRFSLRIARDGGFSIADEVTISVIDVDYHGTTVTTAPLPDGNTGEINLIPIFNPSPLVTLSSIANPGIGNNPAVTVTGAVIDYIAPVESTKVYVNGVPASSVQLIDSGEEGLGPFLSRFTATVNITNGDYLVEAVAVNGLNNLGKDGVQISVQKDVNGNIVARSTADLQSAPSTEPNADRYRFKLRVGVGIPSGVSTIDAEFNTGVERRKVTLTRVGDSAMFESDYLYLVPTNLRLPAGADAKIVNARLRGKFGVFTTLTYLVAGEIPVVKYGIPTGILFTKQNVPMDVIQSGVSSDVEQKSADIVFFVEVGAPGSRGEKFDVDVISLDRQLVNVSQPEPKASFAGVNAKIKVYRQSNSAQDPLYNHYKMALDKSVMAVRTPSRDEATLDEIYSVYRGYVKAESLIMAPLLPEENIEPVSGAEITAYIPNAVPATSSAGIIPDGSPAPPIVSVSQGSPRPVVEITSAVRVPDPLLQIIRVQGTVKDPIADITGGGKADIKTIKINGQDANVTVTRNPNEDPPKPFVGTFDAMIRISQAPDDIDIAANLARIGGPFPLLIAQEAVIVEATNSAVQSGFDSDFVKITDPDGDGIDNAAGAFTDRIVQNDGTTAVAPQKFFAEVNDPLKEGETIPARLISMDKDGNQVMSKGITLKRGKAGHIFRYGPFITASGGPRLPGTPAVADDIPLIFVSPGGQLVLEPVGSMRKDEMECVGCDVKMIDATGANVTETFLPRGSAVTPEERTLRVEATHVGRMQGKTVDLRLINTTHFQGHCNNAPRTVDDPSNNIDFSFSQVQNRDVHYPTETVGGNGAFEALLYSKDYGGRTVIRATIGLPGEPQLELDLPMDGDGDFLPDAWEARPSVGNQRDGLVDLEDAGGAHNEQGDGFTALEEYRGFQITGDTGPQVFRMDEMPSMYFLASGGPQAKDVFVFHQSAVQSGAGGNLDMETTSAGLFNVVFHAVKESDFIAPMPDTTYTGHDHNINFKGDSDGFNTNPNDMQKAVHIMDDTNLPVADQLPAGALASSGSFVLDNTCIRVKVSVAGGSHGFGHGLINGNTIFHEMGHKVSLRHNTGTNRFHVTAVRNVAVGGGLFRGEVDMRTDTYTVATTISQYRLGIFLEGDTGGFGLTEGTSLSMNAINVTGNMVTVGVLARDDFGNPRDLRVRLNIPLPAGAILANTVFGGKIIEPELMDWVDYFLAAVGGASSGPVQQQNFNADQFNVVVPPSATPTELHGEEIRVRSVP